MRQKIMLIAALLAIVGSGLYLAHRLANDSSSLHASAISPDQNAAASITPAISSQQLTELINQEPKIWLVYILGRIEKIELRLDYQERNFNEFKVDVKEDIQDLRSEIRYNLYWMIGGFAVIIGFLWQTRAK